MTPNRQYQRKGAEQLFVVSLDKAQTTIIDFLAEYLAPYSRTTVKQLLRDRYISLNGACVVSTGCRLQEGDKVCLHRVRFAEDIKHPLLSILFQDDHLVVVEKKNGISTVGGGIDSKQTALRIISDHLKQYDPETKLFMINRLDRDTSGFVLFAKNRDLQQRVVERWQSLVDEQIFVGVVEGDPCSLDLQITEAADVRMDPAEKSHSSRGSDRLGAVACRKLSTGGVLNLMEFTLLCGRNNRIRKQMREIGTPLAGDRVGGSNLKMTGCIALESKRLSLRHPVSGQPLCFSRTLPPRLVKLLRNGDALPSPVISRPKNLKTTRNTNNKNKKQIKL